MKKPISCGCRDEKISKSSRIPHGEKKIYELLSFFPLRMDFMESLLLTNVSICSIL